MKFLHKKIQALNAFNLWGEFNQKIYFMVKRT